MSSTSAKGCSTLTMNSATNHAVEFAVDIPLRSIQDENQNTVEAMRHLSGNPGNPEVDPEMFGHIDGNAGAGQSSLEDGQQHRYLLDKVSALHKAHNRVIPLHQLPIEVFVQIITRALEPFRTYSGSGTSAGRLLTLCRVCKGWKDVIDRTPSLWAAIDIRDPAALTALAISRSSNHPLNIIGAPSFGGPKYWGELPIGWKQFEKTAMMHSTRWRSIQLVVASPEDAQALLNAPAPHLQSLGVKSRVQCRVNFQIGGGTLQETGPRLRRLALHRLAIPWRSCMLHDLQYLSISGLDEFAPSCEEILGVLRMCHALVEVDLGLRPAATVEPSKKEHPFTLTQLRIMSFNHISPSWTSVFLETVRTPSVRHVDLDLDFSAAEFLLPSIIKSAYALLSTINDAPYRLVILASQTHLGWYCCPGRMGRGGWSFHVTARNGPAKEILEAILLKKDANRFAPESIAIDLDRLIHSEFSAALQKLNGVNRILEFGARGCDLEPLFTYMSSATTGHGWGLPELKKLSLRNCVYNPARLLNMVLNRYGGEGDGISDGGGRPPPFKHLVISHAPGEADEEALKLVEDIVGNAFARF